MYLTKLEDLKTNIFLPDQALNISFLKVPFQKECEGCSREDFLPRKFAKNNAIVVRSIRVYGGKKRWQWKPTK